MAIDWENSWERRGNNGTVSRKLKCPYVGRGIMLEGV
jgi:hypothetical protein